MEQDKEFSLTTDEFRAMRIAESIAEGLYHVEVKQCTLAIMWLSDHEGMPDYTFSMENFFFDDPNLAFEVKMRFG